ncbi:hypothetical protein [Actinokineospora terrae]|uniref:DUF11 domain-containing protein n=1 Tax=Actinokineospora terrae TaxID=155974 RepID=A0A1H9MEN7_9PSEU|nr:hypothetical protein [Actinokineospora terrae]SER22132.1 hypothetical protein SAMN04487818_102122 [Actinokineospora terrae]
MAVADLTVSAGNDGPWVAGGTGSYTLSVSADLAHERSDKLVTLTHTLPMGLTPTDAEGDDWSCAISGHRVVCLSSRTVAPGESYPPVTVAVRVGRHVTGSVESITGLSVAGSEANTTNNTAASVVHIEPATA